MRINTDQCDKCWKKKHMIVASSPNIYIFDQFRLRSFYFWRTSRIRSNTLSLVLWRYPFSFILFLPHDWRLKEKKQEKQKDKIIIKNVEHWTFRGVSSHLFITSSYSLLPRMWTKETALERHRHSSLEFIPRHLAFLKKMSENSYVNFRPQV